MWNKNKILFSSSKLTSTSRNLIQPRILRNLECRIDKDSKNRLVGFMYVNEAKTTRSQMVYPSLFIFYAQ
jgi:hypothetical protein